MDKGRDLQYDAHGGFPADLRSLGLPVAGFPSLALNGKEALVGYGLLRSSGALGYGFFGGSVAQSIADNIGRDLELQVLPGGLNVLLGAITILGLSTEAAGDTAFAPRCHHRLVRRAAAMERSAACQGS